MKPFHTIAVPHQDILEGRLTMDVFAADLWETYNKRAPSEYKDADLFFRKTYLTNGLKNLLDAVEKRLKGNGGDPVIQIQTPFGGGKTHALIALYHRAIQWKVKPIVVVGTTLNPTEDTLWGVFEKQLTGSVRNLKGNISPGRDALRTLLLKHEPVLILMDEVLEYVTKAAGVAVGETSLSSQTLAFMQELTEVAGTTDKVCVVMTLPSSLLEHYDEKSEKLFNQLQKIAGRVERIYTPVQENEITKVVRSRLFSSFDEKGAKPVVSHFIGYAEKEGILPAETDASDYKNRFIESYPFIPEVIDTLYHRWGSFPTFQRTRGVLRLLSLVIFSMKESSRPYVTLSDFDLAKPEIRRELIQHIGPEFDSVIAADITDQDSGSRKVDTSIGRSFRGLRIGTRSATCIFMYSFSGGHDKGAHMAEIKRSATTTDIPSSVVGEVVEQLKNKLFYMQSQDEKYFFLNQPNMNRILLTKMENIKDNDVLEIE
ncbi:MAG: ATP-binding protein, partial [Nitrososphaerota archaeon]|nr:ATP-binding protein [Nitrososphaerota archaeon]